MELKGFMVFLKQGYHPFSFSIDVKHTVGFFCISIRSFLFLWTFSVNKFFLRSRNVVALPNKLRFCFYISNHNILQEKMIMKQKGTFRTLFQTLNPLHNIQVYFIKILKIVCPKICPSSWTQRRSLWATFFNWAAVTINKPV